MRSDINQRGRQEVDEKVTENEFLNTALGIVLLIVGFTLWYYNRKPKPRYEYYRGLCKSIHYFNEKATEIEQMIQMIYDIENTPKCERKNLTIAIPDTLTREVNAGKFQIKRMRDSDIFIKIIDKQCVEACNLLTEQLDEAIKNGVIFTCDTEECFDDLGEEETGTISVSDYQLGDYEI